MRAFPAPEHSGLRPIPGDKGLPIVGHAFSTVALAIEFLKSRLETYGEICRSPGLAVLPRTAKREVLVPDVLRYQD